MSYSIVYKVSLLSAYAYSLCVLFCGLNILATQDIVVEKIIFKAKTFRGSHVSTNNYQ